MVSLDPAEVENIYEMTKDCDWDYNFLSRFPHITWKMVRNNLNKPWNMATLSQNRIITWDIICENPYIKWNWTGITKNPNITFDIINENIEYPWNFDILKYIFPENDYEQLINKFNINLNLNNKDDDMDMDDEFDDVNVLYYV